MDVEGRSGMFNGEMYLTRVDALNGNKPYSSTSFPLFRRCRIRDSHLAARVVEFKNRTAYVALQIRMRLEESRDVS